MEVINHNKFRKFDYENHYNQNFKLGQVLIKNEFDADETPIGVVIQTHDDGDCRTDQFGNCSTSEVRLATLEEIKQHRNELLADLKPSEVFNGLERYPEFTDAVNEIVKTTLPLISVKSGVIQSEMPYKTQFLLEEVIKKLEDYV